MKYPFTPKSTRFLKSGQYWAIKLKNGKYACGVVVDLWEVDSKVNTRIFIAGLLDWVGEVKPTPDDLESAKLLEMAQAHIKTITHTGSEILGHVPLKFKRKNKINDTWGYNVIKILAEKHFD
jgi:hypothetical protein